MAKPWTHAKSSARKFGGVPEDYIEIHDFMDCSKGAIADNRHRALTHNSWFLKHVIERVFGWAITNSDGKEIPVREIAEQHVLEDFGGFIPTAQDYIQEMEMKSWMNNGMGGAKPESCRKLPVGKTTRRRVMLD